MKIKDFNQLLTEVDSCTICETNLKAGVRPVLQVNPHAKILIAGQAPGSRVHATGIPFDDPSGDRLREWMGINKETFYDSQKIAILPMAFCYPGKGKSGDLPPPPICAETWRNKLLETMPHIQLTLVIGQYALAWHLKNRGKNLTETVKNWAMFGDQIMPLPHPSPRNNIWLKNNPWFEADVLTVLQNRVHNILK
ncbi:uracil-DNA glycosylase family protein [Psychromonas sp. GE-S-Ul-11]|uniref:uracil-DNA glycosylase family protein n=1 Tax=unclassified Psychromonas TaxID=2614957 RepID=UPI00390CA838